MPLQSGPWGGLYFDANEWGGSVLMDLQVNLDSSLSGNATIYVGGTDLGYHGSISGSVTGNEVVISVTSSGPPFATLTFTGFWEDIVSAEVPTNQAMFGIFPPPAQFPNDSSGGTWLLWPGYWQYSNL